MKAQLQDQGYGSNVSSHLSYIHNSQLSLSHQIHKHLSSLDQGILKQKQCTMQAYRKLQENVTG